MTSPIATLHFFEGVAQRHFGPAILGDRCDAAVFKYAAGLELTEARVREALARVVQGFVRGFVAPTIPLADIPEATWTRCYTDLLGLVDAQASCGFELHDVDRGRRIVATGDAHTVAVVGVLLTWLDIEISQHRLPVEPMHFASQGFRGAAHYLEPHPEPIQRTTPTVAEARRRITLMGPGYERLALAGLEVHQRDQATVHWAPPARPKPGPFFLAAGASDVAFSPA